MHPDLVRKQYDFELDQRNGLTSATNIPLVAITVVASATSVILVDYRYGFDYLTYAFGIFTAATLGAIAFSVYSLFRSFWNYDYQKLPRSTDLLKHSQDLYSWHVQNGSNSAEARTHADADFADYLFGRIAEATDWNGQNNTVRGNRLHRAIAAIALGVTLLFPSALLYAYNKVTVEDKVHQVRIINPAQNLIKENSLTSKNNQGSGLPASAPAPAPAPKPFSAAKPSGPPNLVFKGNSDLNKPSADSTPPRK
jgi:hypothetical protein